MRPHKDLEITMNESKAHILAPVSVHDIQILRECSLYCQLSSKACIRNGKTKEALLCAECAEMCDLTIKFKSCHSAFLNEVYKLCALICQKCERVCRKIEIEYCQKCAETCTKCLQFLILQENKGKS